MFKRYLKLYQHYFATTTMANLAYKADFIAWSLVTVGWFAWNIMFYELLFLRVDQIAGWTKGQVLILQGFYFITEFVVWGLIYANIHQLPQRINNGKLDGDLTKPANLQFLLSFREINQNQINSLILGIGTIIYGMNLLQFPWHLSNMIFSLLVFMIGCIFLYGGYFATVCFAFWFDRLNNVVFAFPELRHLAKIPSPAYSGFAKLILTYAIPITLVTTLPSEFLFGQPNWSLAAWLAVISLIVLWFSTQVLKSGLKRYSSASS